MPPVCCSEAGAHQRASTHLPEVNPIDRRGGVAREARVDTNRFVGDDNRSAENVGNVENDHSRLPGSSAWA